MIRANSDSELARILNNIFLTCRFLPSRSTDVEFEFNFEIDVGKPLCRNSCWALRLHSKLQSHSVVMQCQCVSGLFDSVSLYSSPIHCAQLIT